MKGDIDRLMAENGVETLWITGPARHNPSMTYFTGPVLLTRADLVKRRGQEPILFYSPMEREGAARTGLAGRSLNDYKLLELEVLRQSGGSNVRATAARMARIFDELGVLGAVEVYGRVDLGPMVGVLAELSRLRPGLTFVGEEERAVLSRAMITKDKAEVEHVRRIGRITTEVMQMVAEYLTSRPLAGRQLLRRDGQPLTVGDVKRKIHLWLSERGGEDPVGVIFAIGRDAGVPHSSGNAQDVIELGKPIVFDFFPQEAGGGYFYDITRTWCLDHAPRAVEEVYRDVLAAYRHACGMLEPETLCRTVQTQVCRFLESRGHPTVLNSPQTEVGYCHSLGHGVGLNFHEEPRFNHLEANGDRLQPGSVITVEPGLYYPERALGVRLENTLWVRPDGVLEVLADLPLDLVLKMKSKASHPVAASRRAQGAKKRAARKSSPRPKGKRAKPRR
jgi:Xaa-Pro aminopeptidase